MIIVPDTVLNSALKESEKTLFGRILSECWENGTGVCTLSNVDLAERCGCTFVTVSNGVKSLTGAGFITAHVDPKKANERTLKPSETLLKESLIVLADLLKKVVIVHPTIKEIFNSPITENFNSQGGIKENDNSLTGSIKDYFNSRLSPIPYDFQQVKETIINFFNSQDSATGQFSIRATERDIENVSINNTLYKNISSKSLSRAKGKTSEVTENEDFITVQTPSGPLTIAAHELAGVVEIRGADPERVGLFVSANKGCHYNNIPDLRELVRAWLKKNRSDGPKKAQLTIEDRKLAFQASINNFARNHSGLYPNEFYHDFFAYYGEVAKNGKQLRWETYEAFELPTRMDYSYRNIFLPRQERLKYGNSTKQSVTVTADDLNGVEQSTRYSDNPIIDLSGSEEYADTGVSSWGL